MVLWQACHERSFNFEWNMWETYLRKWTHGKQTFSLISVRHPGLIVFQIRLRVFKLVRFAQISPFKSLRNKLFYIISLYFLTNQPCKLKVYNISSGWPILQKVLRQVCWMTGSFNFEWNMSETCLRKWTHGK